MTNEPSENAVKAWARLARAQKTALAHIEARLKAEGLPPLAWYDVLLELERAGETGLRPYALERELLLPQYGLSRLLDRIEKAGYLERRPCPDDGRGQVLVITKSGLQMRRRMWPIYGEAIADAIGSRLTDGQAARLAELLAKVI